MKRRALAVGVVATVVRAVVVLWAAPRFPPAEDGRFYHAVAERIAHGLGYTWAWPDGTVTFAAHYPVGYPALLAVPYALFGAGVGWAMVTNAVLGAGAAVGALVLAERVAGPEAGWFAGLAVALHPGLALYTPALMTEGVAGALLVLACLAATARRAWVAWLGAGVLGGVTTLVRPQMVLLVPLLTLGTLRGRPWSRALVPLVVALAVVAPWTTRNCARLGRCTFVSANGGWNLLIGTASEGHGAWLPIDVVGVPMECRTVWGEADKDACFGAAGARRIAAAPLAWAALIPEKLATTFDPAGAAGHYLRASNAAALPEVPRRLHSALDLAWQRGLVGWALMGLALAPGPRRGLRRALAAVGAFGLVTPWAWLGYVTFALGAAALGTRLERRPDLAHAGALVGTTALTHAVFFGGARYALVCGPVLAVAAGVGFAAWRRRGTPGPDFDTPAPAGR